MAEIMITAEGVSEQLTALVAEYGEGFVYKKHPGGNWCTYVHEGKPDCGVGHVLFRLGVPLERLIKADGEECGQSVSADGLIDLLTEEGVAKFEPGVRYMLTRFQHLQDAGMSWGYSLEKALKDR